jgi:hypothetical protein
MRQGAIAAVLVLGIGTAHGAELLSYKNMPADKDVVLYQSGDKDIRQRVSLCFWFRAESGNFKITSERFTQAVELHAADEDKPSQRVICGSILTVRTSDKENALQYAVVK